jgi:hypothetical protein
MTPPAPKRDWQLTFAAERAIKAMEANLRECKELGPDEKLVICRMVGKDVTHIGPM